MIMNGPPVEKADRIMPLRRCKSTTLALGYPPPVAPVALACQPPIAPTDLACQHPVAPVDLACQHPVAPVDLASPPQDIDFQHQAASVDFVQSNVILPFGLLLPILLHNEPTKRRLFSTCTNTQPESYNSMPVLILPPPIASFPSNITDTVVHINSPNCTLTKNDTILEMLQLRQQNPTVTQYQSDDDSTTEDYMSLY